MQKRSKFIVGAVLAAALIGAPVAAHASAYDDLIALIGKEKVDADLRESQFPQMNPGGVRAPGVLPQGNPLELVTDVVDGFVNGKNNRINGNLGNM